MTLDNLNELFVHELKDLYDAEHQLLEALPKLAEAAASPELKAAFEKHLDQTRGQIARLEEVFSACGEAAERQTCNGMKGLIKEGEKMIKEDAAPDVKDAGLISAAQRVEHYEIAAYGTLAVWARTAGIEGVEELLQENMSEEKAADGKLTEIAESGVNAGAGHEEDEDATPTRSKKANGGRARARPARPSRARR